MGGHFGEFGVNMGRLGVVMNITNIACRVRTQCFITSPIGNTWVEPKIGVWGSKWGKNFLVGERSPQKELTRAETRRLSYYALILVHKILV